MSVSSALSKAKKLIALSGSSNKHEAENAAIKACEIIRANKLVLTSETGETDEPVSAASAPPARPAWYNAATAAAAATRPKAGPTIHLTVSGKTALCNQTLSTGSNYIFVADLGKLRPGHQMNFMNNGCRLCVSHAVRHGFRS